MHKPNDAYSKELLQFIENLKWNESGVDDYEISESHPFKSVFDALLFVKQDVIREKMLYPSYMRVNDKYSIMKKVLWKE